jgi:hypothetical protein
MTSGPRCGPPTEVLLSGPAGTGKSRACLEKLHLCALLNPGMRGLLVRKTLVSLASSAIKTWERDVIREALADGSVYYYGGSSREVPQYRYSNGSTISVAGMDKPSRIMSTEFDLVYVQEATELDEEAWEAITTRLRNGVMSFQQVIADCNPDTPTHWLRQRCDRGQTTELLSKHEDNPMLFDEQGQVTERGAAYIAKLDALTGVRYLRLRKGIWAASEGVIYDGYDPSVHVVDRFDVPQDWPRLWAIDFGYVHPFVWQDWAEDPDGRLFLVREIYHSKRLVEDHARKIRELHTDSEGRWVGPRPELIVADHDAEDRATLERHLQMPTTAANKKVSEGIQAVAGRWKVVGDGRARLFLMRDAVVERDQELADAKQPTSTQEEVPGYVWAVGKEQPLKVGDDGCDAMRYVVAARDLRSQFRLRWL